jgi:predicted RNA-binding Zn ribbon-like protein
MPEAGNYCGRHQIVIPRRDLAIDFANTVAYRGSKAEDSLRTFSDLAGWLSSASALPQAAIEGLPKLIAAARSDTAKVWAAAIALRETIYRLLHAAAARLSPPPDDLKRLNYALAGTPERSSIAHTESGYGWGIEIRPTAAGILTPVIWSAADLLAGPDYARIRECANPQCLWLFLDDSKNGTRRWCSMQACGNRAKAHRHYQRQKQSGE